MACVQKATPQCSVDEVHTPLKKILEARDTALPSRYEPNHGDVQLWCKEKAQRESRQGGAEGDPWMVHGKWYDLSGYIDSHPGGRDWLLLTRGQDITEAYEVHHLNSKKVKAVLNSMYVKDASKEYVGKYTWDEQGFYMTLKRRVAAHFGTNAKGRPDTGPTTYFLALCGFAVAIHFLSFAAMLYAPCWWMAVLAGLTLQTFHGIGHNFLHMADNAWMYCYDFCGWKHHMHRVSHALSHHLYPNTKIDLEDPEPHSYSFTSNSQENSPWVIFTGPFFMWSGPLRTIIGLWPALLKGEEAWRHEYLFNMVQLLLLAWAAGPLHGALLFSIMHFITGFCIETAGFGLHRSIFCWSDGDPNAKYDYGEQALCATADHDVDMPLLPSLYFFQILNNHGVHHLFPTVDKSRMAEIMPIFRQTVEEFDIPWKEYPWQEMFTSIWANWLQGVFTEATLKNTPPRGHMIVSGSSLRIKHTKDQTLGAEVTGVQVANLSQEEFKAISKALVERGVIVIKDQEATPQEQVNFSKRFPHSKICDKMKFCGPLALDGFDAEEWRNLKMKEVPEIQLRGFDDLKDYYGVTASLNTGKGAKEFHSDSVHEYDTPPVITQLFCVATPGYDDSTLFIDCRLAYDLLSEGAKDRAETLFVQYKRVPSPLDESGLKADFGADLKTLGDIYGAAVANAQGGDQGDDIVSEVHPLVWTHPISGRKAVISAAMWMYRIVESDGTPWTVEESHDYIYKMLKPVADRQYAHKWCPKDLVLFDNRSLMHSASSAPMKQGRRLLHQVLLCGNAVPTGPAGQGVGNPIVNPRVTSIR